jgi:hypothetical protein
MDASYITPLTLSRYLVDCQIPRRHSYVFQIRPHTHKFYDDI